MEEDLETTVMGYIGTAMRIHSFIGWRVAFAGGFGVLGLGF